MKVLILHTEVSGDACLADQDDLQQADAVSRALERLGHDWEQRPFSDDVALMEAELRRIDPLVVVNLVESVNGRGDLIAMAPQLLDSLGYRYTGCSGEALDLSSNKLEAKRRLRNMGLPTPDWLDLRDMLGNRKAEGRYIIKSVWEHGSLGIDGKSVVEVESAAELCTALKDRLPALNGLGFAERFVDGREFNVGVISGPDGPQVLMPAELRFAPGEEGKPDILDYDSKWEVGSESFDRSYRSFAHRPEDRSLLAELQELSMSCWHCFGLRGYARVDFRIDPRLGPMIIDINANPCLSPDAGFAAALEKAGVSYDEAVHRLLEDALEHPGFERLAAV